MDSQKHKYTDIHTQMQTCIKTGIYADNQKDRLTDTERRKHTDIETETDTWKHMQTNTDTDRESQEVGLRGRAKR